RRLADRQAGDIRDRSVVDGDGERDRLEPLALARRARDVAHVALEPLAARVALGLAVAALHPRDHALVGRPVGPLAPIAVAVFDVHLQLVAVEDRLARL